MRWSLLCLTAAAFTGCDWLLTVEADTRVEPAVQQALTSWPQQLLLHHDALESSDSPGTRRLAVLCAPSAEPVVARWRYSYINGCGEPATLTAWLEPLDPAAGLPCGAIPGEGEPLPADRLPPANTPVASVRVFETGGRCPHNAAVELSLAFPVP